MKVASVLCLVTLASLAGGCVTGIQVKRTSEHSNVNIRFEHPATERDDEYADSVVLNGTRVELGAPQGGTLHLRLRPGRYELTLQSARLERELGFVTRETPYGICVDVNCRFMRPAKRESLEYVWTPEPLCEHSVVLKIAEGERLDATFSVSDEGVCSATGV